MATRTAYAAPSGPRPSPQKTPGAPANRSSTLIQPPRVRCVVRSAGRRHVPAHDGADVVLGAEDAGGGGVEQQLRAEARVDVEPAGGEHPERVPVADDHDVTVLELRAYPVEHRASPGGH